MNGLIAAVLRRIAAAITAYAREFDAAQARVDGHLSHPNKRAARGPNTGIDRQGRDAIDPALSEPTGQTAP